MGSYLLGALEASIDYQTRSWSCGDFVFCIEARPTAACRVGCTVVMLSQEAAPINGISNGQNLFYYSESMDQHPVGMS